MKPLEQVIAESLSKIYGWPMDKVDDSAKQLKADIEAAWLANRQLYVAPPPRSNAQVRL